MTQDRMQLSELLEKAGADDIVRDMIGFVAQRLMEQIGRASCRERVFITV